MAQAETDVPVAERACPDCGVPVGAPHVDGCDVARCTVCGMQRIGCEHEGEDVGWGQVWTGRWPGEAECEEFGWWAIWSDTVMIGDKPVGTGRCIPVDRSTPGAFPDLNRLVRSAATGQLEWDGQRWQRAAMSTDGESRSGSREGC